MINIIPTGCDIRFWVTTKKVCNQCHVGDGDTVPHGAFYDLARQWPELCPGLLPRYLRRLWPVLAVVAADPGEFVHVRAGAQGPTIPLSLAFD